MLSTQLCSSSPLRLPRTSACLSSSSYIQRNYFFLPAYAYLSACSPPPPPLPALTLSSYNPPHPNSYNSAAVRASILETSLRVIHSLAIGPAVSKHPGWLPEGSSEKQRNTGVCLGALPAWTLELFVSHTHTSTNLGTHTQPTAPYISHNTGLFIYLFIIYYFFTLPTTLTPAPPHYHSQISKSTEKCMRELGKEEGFLYDLVLWDIYIFPFPFISFPLIFPFALFGSR